MTVKEILEQLEALINEKIRAQHRKLGTGDDQLQRFLGKMI